MSSVRINICCDQQPAFALRNSGTLFCSHAMLQVLIFSQFKIMMDVLEDSFRLRQYPVERIDGSVSSRDRQAAIDRYSKGKLLA